MTIDTWGRTTADLITEAEAAIRALGYELKGKPCERWEGDGVMVVTPADPHPRDGTQCWYLTLIGIDRPEYYPPGVSLVVIRPKSAGEDLQVALTSWAHLSEVLRQEGYLP